MISTDFSLPSFLEREKTQTVSMPLYVDGSDPVAPTSGTYTLYDQNKVVITTGAVTITAKVATYSVTAAMVPATVALSDEWQELWVLTVDGVTETIRRDAYLCRRVLYNVVNEAMLKRRVTDLASLKPSNITSFQGYIDEAFSQVQTQLLQQGKRPYLIMNSWALKGVVLATTLQLMFEDFETYMGEGRFSLRAKEYQEQAEKAFSELKLEYDSTESDRRASAVDSAPAAAVIYTNSPPRWFRQGWGPF